MPSLGSFAIMSNPWLVEESKDLAAPATKKVEKYLTSGKILGLESLGDTIVHAKQGPPSHANKKADGRLISVVLASSPIRYRHQKSMYRPKYLWRELYLAILR